MLSLDIGSAAHKLPGVPNLCRTARALCLGAALTAGCGEEAPRPRPVPPAPPPPVPSPSVAEITGWPAGIGRALLVRLPSGEDQHRLVVPELGDRRFADSALTLKPGDILPVVLLDRRGNAGDSRLLVVDAETGAGSCVTWPTAELTGTTYRRRASTRWRVAAERDSVTAIALDSLAGLRGVDSLRLVSAVNSLISSVPPARDSVLHGIPYAIRRAYSFSAGGVRTVAAEVVRTSAQEANPRGERLFLVGEIVRRDPSTYRTAYSRRSVGHADSVAATQLLAAVVPRQSERPVLILGFEDPSGLRPGLLEREGAGRWRLSWAAVVMLC